MANCKLFANNCFTTLTQKMFALGLGSCIIISLKQGNTNENRPL